MDYTPLSGLIAATYTPFDERGQVAVQQIDALVEYLISAGVDGLYICGTTGEGMSLSCDEREIVAERFVQQVAGRIATIIQVGHNSLPDAQRLSHHAERIGATAFSATCPSYYPVNRTQELLAWLQELTQAAPKLPFYYYHIPAFTGSQIDIVESITLARSSIANLVGLKYTDTKLHEFQLCLETFRDEFDVMWGCDEMLLGALSCGAQAAIGSTYNIASAYYRQVIQAANDGNLEEARVWQLKAVRLINTLSKFPFHSAMKHTLRLLGIECGAVRLPQREIRVSEKRELESQLESLGFLDEIRSLTSNSVA